MDRSTRDKLRAASKSTVKSVLAVGFCATAVYAFLELEKAEENPLELVSQHHQCQTYECAYTLTVKNSSPGNVLGFARINAFHVTSGGTKRGGDLSAVGTERIEFTIEPNSSKTLKGKIKTTQVAGMLNINVGRANESI